MKNDSFYMNLAISEAKIAYELGEVPIGAVIIDEEGRIVAKAHNMRELWQDATAHAELIAVREACKALKRWRLSDMTLYVTVEPCPMCAGALVMSRIKRLVYGCADSKAGASESIFNVTSHESLNHRMDITAGVLEEECRNLMKNFFRERRAVKKACKEGV